MRQRNVVENELSSINIAGYSFDVVDEDRAESCVRSFGSKKSIDHWKRRTAIIFVFLAVFIDSLGITLAIPINANLTRDIQGEPDSCCPSDRPSDCKHGSLYSPNNPTVEYYKPSDPDIPKKCEVERIQVDSNVGISNTMFAAGNLVSTLWLPRFSDSFGRRPAFFVSLFGSFLGFLLFALAPNFIALLAFRFVAGLFGGSAVVADAYIADSYQIPTEKDDMFARLGASFMFAVMFGPIIGGGLATLFSSLRAPLYFAAALSLLSLGFSYFFLIEPKELFYVTETNDPVLSEEVSEVVEIGQETRAESTSEFSAWKDVWNLAIGIATFLTGISFNALTSLLALLLLEPRYDVVDLDDSIAQQGEDMSLQIGFDVMILAAVSIPIMLILFPIMVKHMGLLQTGVFGSMAFGACIFSMPFTQSNQALMGLMAVTGVAMGLELNVSTIFLAANAPGKHVASTLAVGQSFDAAAQILGPFLTLLYRIDVKTPFFVAAVSSWLAAGVLSTMALVLAYRVHKKMAFPLEAFVFDERPWEMYSSEFLDNLEEQVRKLPQRSPVLGTPTVDEDQRLVDEFFRGKEPGVEYDEVWAKYVVSYVGTLVSSWRESGHLQLMSERANLGKLDALAARRPEFEANGNLDEYDRERAKELHLELVHQRVVEIEQELLRRAHVFIPEPEESLESQAAFLGVVREMLLDLGHEDWAAQLPVLKYSKHSSTRGYCPH